MTTAVLRLPAIRLGLLVAVLVGAALAALAFGHTWMSPLRLMDLIAGTIGGTDHLALTEVRLPRLGAACGGGACLAVAGCLLQRLTGNGLADPGILGITGCAGFALILLLATTGTRQALPAWMPPAAAAAGAVLGTALVLALVRGRALRAPLVLILVGIAVGATAGAVGNAIAVALDPSLLRLAVAWQAGSLAGVAALPAVVLPFAACVGLGLAWLGRSSLDAVALGDASAIALGVRVDALRRDGLLLAALLTALAVAWCGGLTFVGFLAPHCARRLVGERAAWLLPASACCGALLLLIADVLGRSLFAPRELPAGVLVGILGAPVFLVLLARQGMQR